MTQEDKQLLLKDLCARLPYEVICDRLGNHYPLIEIDIKRELVYLLRDDYYVPYSISRGDIIKPYLRPISSMSNEEVDKLFSILNIDEEVATEWLKVNNTNVIRLFTQEGKDFYEIAEAMDYLYSIHIDFRGLIEKGLALEAPKDMYKEWISIRGNLKEDKKGNIVGGLKL